MSSILITGAGGAIGRQLIAQLRRSGDELVLFLRRGEKDPSSGASRISYGDLLDKKSLRFALTGVDAVIHLAGLTHTNKERLYDEINISGTVNLLEACEEKKVSRFIFISSRTAGLNGGAYARSKYFAEEAVKKSHLDWVTLRLAEVYGAGEKEAISSLINIIKSSYFVPIIGQGQYKISPIFIDDVVKGIGKVLDRPAINKQTYLLAGPEEFTYNELIDRLERELNFKRRRIYLPVSLVRAALVVFSWLGLSFFVKDQLPRLLSKKSADISQAIKDLDFQPRTFSVGLRELLNREYPL